MRWQVLGLSPSTEYNMITPNFSCHFSERITTDICIVKICVLISITKISKKESGFLASQHCH